MPFGDKLWEEKSKTVGMRINDVSERGIQEEVSFVGEIKGFGRLNGTKGRIFGTDSFWEKITGGEGVVQGNANGMLRLEGKGGSEVVGFKALGLGKLVKRSPSKVQDLLSIIWFPDPPPEFSWMKSTIVIWEAFVDPKAQTIEATAYEWAGSRSRAKR
jgi:hypothetical protein